MASIFSLKCSSCGKTHVGAPSFGYDAPAPYREISEALRIDAHLGTDLCWYSEDGEINRFIRVCLEVPIHGFDEPFTWGVWVSLSEQSFNRYVETSNAPIVSDSYFGWFCNRLPYYSDTYALKANVRPRIDGLRPIIEMQESAHELAQDYKNGISIARAQKIAEVAMHTFNS